MEEKKKRAYRYLLYLATLDVRTLQIHGKAETITDEDRKKNVLWASSCGALAYWLHNLALASVDDFEGFNESAFWNQYEYFNDKFPDFGFGRYKKSFDDQSGPV
jgi:hypothetical protein